MRPATVEFLRQRFLSYYTTAQIGAPNALAQREWGFLFFSSSGSAGMRRHIGFGSRDELVGYLRTLTPAHVFYSTAYYEDPAAPTMAAKGWTGADLIFDLDADHIIDPRTSTYPEMLARVRDETVRLLAVLTDELGFAERDLQVVFSGGRGYHVHVKDLALRHLSSVERRELINYVSGIGLDPTLLLRQTDHPERGWQGRQRRALREYLAWLDTMGESDALAHLSSLPGIGSGRARRIWDRRAHLGTGGGDTGDRRLLRLLLSPENPEWRNRIREAGIRADEPVTTDIKRLIRAPGTLHGGSGLRVTPIEVGDLCAFDPLVDAVVFSDREVTVEVLRPCHVPFPGSQTRLEAGPAALAEASAVYLCARGLAEMGGVHA